MAAVICAFSLAIGSYRAYAVPAAPDVALYVWLASRVLAGAHLYRDVLEINPPLVVWLNIPSVWLAQTFDLAPIVIYHSTVLALTAVSAAVSVRLVVAAFPEAKQSTWQRWLALLSFVLLVLPGFDFGQREHILLILVLPYLAISVCRVVGRSPVTMVCITVGAAAGVAIALKPFFGLLWVALEALLTFGPPKLPFWRRMESLIAIALIATYSIAVVLLFPGYLQLLHDYGALYHSFLEQPATSLMRTQGALWTMCAIALFALIRPRRDYAPVARVLAVASLALAMAACLQQKGWAYHFYPAFALSTLLILTLMQGTSLNSDSALLRRSHAMAVALLVATVLTVVRDIAAEFAVATGREDEARDALALMPVVRRYGAGDAVMIFSPTHSIAFPLILEADVRWTSRYVSMWPMRAFYDARMAGDKSFADLEKRFIRDVVDDMTRAPPRLIVVDAATTRLAEDHGVSGLGYFERDPRFASLLTEYDRVADVRRYRVFRRNRSSPRPR